MSSHRSWILAVVGSALLVVLGASAFAQVKVPPDFSFTQGKDSPGPVTFSHEKHKERTEKCNVCHVKVFKMKKIATSATASDVNTLLHAWGRPASWSPSSAAGPEQRPRRRPATPRESNRSSRRSSVVESRA